MDRLAYSDTCAAPIDLRIGCICLLRLNCRILTGNKGYCRLISHPTRERNIHIVDVGYRKRFRSADRAISPG